MEKIEIIIQHECEYVDADIIPVVPDATGKRFEVIVDTTIILPKYELEFVIEQGYISNLASIPQRLWSIASPLGYHWRASVIHDFLYDNPEVIDNDLKLADTLFKDIMYTHDTKKWKVNSFYYLVSKVGYGSWFFKNIMSKFVDSPKELV